MIKEKLEYGIQYVQDVHWNKSKTIKNVSLGPGEVTVACEQALKWGFRAKTKIKLGEEELSFFLTPILRAARPAR